MISRRVQAMISTRNDSLMLTGEDRKGAARGQSDAFAPNRTSSFRIGYLVGYDTAKGLGAGYMNETGHLLAGSAALLTMPGIVRAQTTKSTKRSVTLVWVEISESDRFSRVFQEACPFFD
jgi:hypothetical protein